MDTVSGATRSRVMARVKSKGNRSTERRLRAGLIRAGLRGWNMHPPGVTGCPDFVFSRARLAIFTDGCFWHGCPRCRRIPSSNVSYWDPKIERNRRRDRRIGAALRRKGWRVVRIWEHDLKDLRAVVRRIERRLRAAALTPAAAPSSTGRLRPSAGR